MNKYLLLLYVSFAMSLGIFFYGLLPNLPFDGIWLEGIFYSVMLGIAILLARRRILNEEYPWKDIRIVLYGVALVYFLTLGTGILISPLIPVSSNVSPSEVAPNAIMYTIMSMIPIGVAESSVFHVELQDRFLNKLNTFMSFTLSAIASMIIINLIFSLFHTFSSDYTAILAFSSGMALSFTYIRWKNPMATCFAHVGFNMVIILMMFIGV
jgi:hypothetical protein